MSAIGPQTGHSFASVQAYFYESRTISRRISFNARPRMGRSFHRKHVNPRKDISRKRLFKRLLSKFEIPFENGAILNHSSELSHGMNFSNFVRWSEYFRL